MVGRSCRAGPPGGGGRRPRPGGRFADGAPAGRRRAVLPGFGAIRSRLEPGPKCRARPGGAADETTRSSPAPLSPRLTSRRRKRSSPGPGVTRAGLRNGAGRGSVGIRGGLHEQPHAVAGGLLGDCPASFPPKGLAALRWRLPSTPCWRQAPVTGTKRTCSSPPAPQVRGRNDLPDEQLELSGWPYHVRMVAHADAETLANRLPDPDCHRGLGRANLAGPARLGQRSGARCSARCPRRRLRDRTTR